MQRLNDQEELRSLLIFGSGATETKIPSLARATRIPAATLYRLKKKPDNMTLGSFRKIAKARKLSAEEIKRIVMEG